MNVGIVCDLMEERWYSMDMVADVLFDSLQQVPGVSPTRIRPSAKLRFSRLPYLGRHRLARNADRFINRFLEYPRRLKDHLHLDVFHIVDHSYANLVHALPADRVVVTCHDLDAFRCLLEPHAEPRSRLFRAMTKRILSGLRQAACVACDSAATRDGLLRYGVLEPSRLELVPLGIDPCFSPDPHDATDLEARRLLGEPDLECPEILHVGSVVERKRIDVLLRVFAGVREQFPTVRLIRAGGAFTAAQQDLLQRLDLGDSVIVFPYLSRPVLAAMYRRAAVVLMTSDREGFGLPVAEAMACGSLVIASDLPVLRETGGEAATYCRLDNIEDRLEDVEEWIQQTTHLLSERACRSEVWRGRLLASLRQAARFTALEYARRMSDIYFKLAA